MSALIKDMKFEDVTSWWKVLTLFYFRHFHVYVCAV